MLLNCGVREDSSRKKGRRFKQIKLEMKMEKSKAL